MPKKKDAVAFEIDIQIVPVSGEPTVKKVVVQAGATLAEAMKEAGVKDLKKKNLLIDGNPATPNTRLTSAAKVAVQERPQGS